MGSKVRDQCVVSDILALGTPAALLLQQGYKAIIISGGPNSVYAADAPLYVFQCREFIMHAITQQGIRGNGGEKRCLRWAIQDPSKN
ncbi:putative GMP synthase [Daphnia magna]|uniref:Putative GMP synthase n=1 Tax=Daphnia magna TaxID=35525 RepID=A0A164KGI4_9CRUS|nr:putative GMP synthase [Daphnia magna]